MIIDSFNMRPNAGGGSKDVAHQRKVDFVVGAWVPGRVHQLNGEIDPLGRAVGAIGRHDVLLAQDRGFALDHKPGALIRIGDDAVAKDDALTRLQLNLEGHDRLRAAARIRDGSRSSLTERKKQTAAGTAVRRLAGWPVSTTE